MNIVTIIIAIIVFGCLIFVHELGHFVAAKSSKVRVNEFALGMGPVIFRFERGETAYSLRAFPIGGFCAMEGEDGEASDNPRVLPDSQTRAFNDVSLWKRIVIMLAGALMNLLLGLIILGILTAQEPYLGSTVVAGFHEGATSSQSLMAGDRILKVNNHRVRTDNDMVYEFMRSRDGVMTMVVQRDGEQVALDRVAFQMRQYEDGSQGIIVDFTVAAVEKTPLRVVGNAFNWTGSIIKQVWGAFADLITGRYGFNQLSGPVGVTVAIGQASSMGLDSLLLLVAFITVNLGVFNLLPLPALDGGRLLFLLIEAVRRRPVNPKYEAYVHAVGFALLICLMVAVTIKDLWTL